MVLDMTLATSKERMPMVCLWSGSGCGGCGCCWFLSCFLRFFEVTWWPILRILQVSATIAACDYPMLQVGARELARTPSNRKSVFELGLDLGWKRVEWGVKEEQECRIFQKEWSGGKEGRKEGKIDD